jgi:hypothetical protein
VSWERRLLDLFEDLEQQAAGAALAARDLEVAELARAEYSEVDLASRFHASLGRDVELTGPHGLVVRGRMARVGAGWCLVVPGSSGPGQGSAASETEEWLFVLPALVAVRGLSPQALLPASRPLTSRLGLGSVLRGVAEERRLVTLVRSDGERRQGTLGRVGQDFFELLRDDGGLEIVPFSAVAALRR